MTGYRALAAILCILIILLFLPGCEKKFFSPGAPKDQPAEDLAPEGEGVQKPWLNDEAYPAIIIIAPVAGKIFEDDWIEVAGNIVGPFPDEFTVNEKPVNVGKDGSFQTQQQIEPNGPILQILSEANAGGISGAERVLAIKGQSQNEKEPIRQALAINLTEDFLNILAAELSATVSKFSFDGFLSTVNPIIDLDNLCVEITSIDLSDTAIEMDLSDKGLRIDASVFDLELSLSGELSVIGFPIVLEGNAKAGRIDFSATATAETDAQDQPVILLSEISTEIRNFSLDFQNVPDWVFLLVNPLVRELVEAMVVFLFEQVVPDALNAVLNLISLDTDIGTLHLYSDIESIAIEKTGVSAVLAANLTPDAAIPKYWQVDESLFTPGNLPPYFDITPDYAKPYHIALTLGDDIFNRAFFSMTNAGLFELNLSSPVELPGNLELDLLAGSFASLFPSLGGIDPQMPIRIHLEPSVPPVIAPTGNPGNQDLFAFLGFNLSVFLDTGDPLIGEWEAFSVGFDIAGKAGVDVDATGALRLSVEISTLEAQVLHNRIGEEKALLISGALELISGALDTVFEWLESVRINLPSVLGYRFIPLSIVNDAENGNYLTVYLLLEKL